MLTSLELTWLETRVKLPLPACLPAGRLAGWLAGWLARLYIKRQWHWMSVMCHEMGLLLCMLCMLCVCRFCVCGDVERG